MSFTKLSSKGQVVLPQPIRDAHRWKAGTEFSVEDHGDGVLLRPVKKHPPTRLEDVIGCAGYTGPVLTVEDMNAAVVAEARRRFLRSKP